MKQVLPSAEWLVTSVSKSFGKSGGGGGRRRESEKKEEETSANYNVQQAKLQRRLRLSPATLKNDRLSALYRVRGLRIGCIKRGGHHLLIEGHETSEIVSPEDPEFAQLALIFVSVSKF